MLQFVSFYVYLYIPCCVRRFAACSVRNLLATCTKMDILFTRNLFSSSSCVLENKSSFVFSFNSHCLNMILEETKCPLFFWTNVSTENKNFYWSQWQLRMNPKLCTVGIWSAVAGFVGSCEISSSLPNRKRQDSQVECVPEMRRVCVVALQN